MQPCRKLTFFRLRPHPSKKSGRLDQNRIASRGETTRNLMVFSRPPDRSCCPAFSSTFFRGSHTTTLATCGMSRSYNHAALVPSSKVTHKLPRSPDEFQDGGCFRFDDAAAAVGATASRRVTIRQRQRRVDSGSIEVLGLDAKIEVFDTLFPTPLERSLVSQIPALELA